VRVLYLAHWYPFPADNGIRLRLFNLVRSLAQRHEVDFVSFTAEALTTDRLQTMRNFCRQVRTVPEQHYRPSSHRALFGFFDARPRSVVDTDSPEMHALVAELAKSGQYDVVIASELGMAPYALHVPCRARLLEDVELAVIHEQFSQASSLTRRLRFGLTWLKLDRYVRHLLRSFQVATAVSDSELARLNRLAPLGLRQALIPNGVDVCHYKDDWGAPVADTLVYAGALTYSANFDAVDYFLREVLPLIQRQRPGVRLRITGKLEGAPVHRLPERIGVTFTGYLNDVRPTIAQSWVSVVPLRVGSGTRLKILEALALGTPVVSTSKGAEGLGLKPEHDLLLADTPAEFADAVVRLLGDPGLRQRLSEHGRQTVVACYDWQMIGQKLDDLLHWAIAQPAPALATA
jgi:glycosyltransferase involved in cell wall biosynthesis